MIREGPDIPSDYTRRGAGRLGGEQGRQCHLLKAISLPVTAMGRPTPRLPCRRCNRPREGCGAHAWLRLRVWPQRHARHRLLGHAQTPGSWHNWSAPDIEREVHQLVDEPPWFRIYDLAERLYASVARQDGYRGKAEDYGRRLNDVFREHGIGWKMDDGWIVYRWAEGFERTITHAVPMMTGAGAPTAAAEIHEACPISPVAPNPTSPAPSSMLWQPWNASPGSTMGRPARLVR